MLLCVPVVVVVVVCRPALRVRVPEAGIVAGCGEQGREEGARVSR